MEEKKSFREVIRDIDVGEVWVADDVFDIESISLGKYNQLEIKRRNGNFSTLYIPSEKIFSLKCRQTYTFTEAWNSLHEGKIIQSVRSGLKYEKTKDYYCVAHKEFWVNEESVLIDTKDMEGEWYIYE